MKQPPAKKRSRRWLKRIGLSGLALIGLLVAMPVWLPWVVVPILKGQGVSVAAYDRQGVGYLGLNALSYSNESTSVEIGRLTVQLPHVWLMDRFARSPKNRTAQFEIWDWNVILLSSGDPDAPSTNSLHEVLDVSTHSLNLIRPWVRHIRANGGHLEFQDLAVEIPQITITDAELRAQFSSSNLTTGAEVVLGIERSNAFRLNVVLPDRALTNELVLRRDATNWQFGGAVNWKNNDVELGGAFSEKGWLPESAAVSGTNWIVAADTVGLDGYQALSGSFLAGWTNGHYEFQINGEALPAVDSPLIPDSISIDVVGQGTLETIAIETLNISTPALLAQLSSPLAIDFTGRMLVPETTLKVSAEFITEDRLPFTGLLEGSVTARPDVDEIVSADFQVRLNKFDGFGLSLDQVNLNGAIHWPQMVVSNCSFTFPGAGEFTMNGELDLLTQVSTNFQWSFSGLIPTNMLPANVSVGDWDASGAFSGAWPQLSHETKLRANTIDWSGSKLDLAAIELSGNVLRTNDWNMQLTYGVAALSAAGSVDLTSLNDSQLSAQLKSVEAIANEKTTVTLEKPAGMSLSWSTEKVTNAISPFALLVDPINLSGSEKELQFGADLNWPESGIVSITVANFRSVDVSGLWSAALPEINLSEFKLNANWNDGPVSFSTMLTGSWNLHDVGLVDWIFAASGDESGIQLSPSQLGFNGEPVLTFGGKIPIQLNVHHGDPKYVWSEQGAFDVQMATLPSAVFWREIADRSTIRFAEPRFELTATGDLDDFQSGMKFEATSVSSQTITNLPTGYSAISNLLVRASVTRDSAEISEGRFTVIGQPAKFEARFPFEASSWEEWFNNLTKLDWKKGSGKFQIPTIDMAAFDRVAGKFIRPVGQVSLDVRLESGGLVDGLVVFTNLASRSIEPIGSVRNIQGEIQIENQRAQLKNVQATVSGRPLSVAGGLGWTSEGLSDVGLSLVATNVTLIRSVDMFLRGDLDLKIQSEGTAPPTIGGVVSLHDSLLFQDIGNVMAIDLNQPEKRPPFFSVPQEPFADWLLDIRVKGQKFLRVMSPVFKGKVSTGLQLGGTLKEPVALGDVSIESGQIIFPFGSLDVNRGLVQLTRENPHQPKIDFGGQGMNFGYNISINVTGNADAPNIVFNSVPPLTTREIMLMLTAGEIPSGDYSYTDVDKASKLGYFLGKELINQMVGMDTGESKLLFRTGEYVTEDGQLTYRVEYKLINWLSLFGEYTRFRDYNGGLKFNIFSR